MTPVKTTVASNFSSAAASYDGWAAVQNLAAERLIAEIPDAHTPHYVLDIGCGTGLLTRRLLQRFSWATITGIDIAPAMVASCTEQWPEASGHCFVTADAEHYCGEAPFDLIASNFAFQWFEHKAETITAYARQLSLGGIFALAVPVAGTLAELEHAHQQALDRPMAGLNYPSSDVYIAQARDAGMQVMVAATDDHVISYASALTALKSFKEIGAVFGGHPDRRPMSPREIARLTQTYETLYRHEGQVPVTYRVLTLVATI